MAAIDVDALRSHLEDNLGAALFNGFPSALLDLSDIQHMSGYELCGKAEDLGVDLRLFEIKDDGC